MAHGGKREGAGRKPKTVDLIDLEKLEQLAAVHCTEAEMAAQFNMSWPTFDKLRQQNPQIKEVIERGKYKGTSSLRSAQYKAALAGNPTMLIWMGKQILGQRDDIPTVIDGQQQKAFLPKWLQRKLKADIQEKMERSGSTNPSQPSSDSMPTSRVDSKDTAVQ